MTRIKFKRWSDESLGIDGQRPPLQRITLRIRVIRVICGSKVFKPRQSDNKFLNRSQDSLINFLLRNPGRRQLFFRDQQ